MTENVVVALVIASALMIVLVILRLRRVSMSTLLLGLIGTIIGLSLGALASVSLSRLPQPLGGTLPLSLTIVLTVVAIVVVLSRQETFLHYLPFLKAVPGETPEASPVGRTQILVDTSVIIDGRIGDIATAGFVPGRLIVPRFVLAELQNIADSDDAMRRGRGRRGLEVLNRLREMDDVEVEITDEDVSGIKEVDAKLVALAQRFKCNVLTTDYNLNRVAAIQGVRVLNVNELSNAIRPVVLPGEELIVRVVQPGKERNQGVGYLADGTMIVVENGDKLMGQEVSTEVTRVFQTVAGKMIFATPRTTVSAAAPKPSAPAEPPVQAAPASGNDGVPTESAEAAPNRNGRHRNRKRGNGNGKQDASGSIEDRIIEHNQQP